MKGIFYNTLCCANNAGHGLVLTLRATPVWESTPWFSVPAAQLALGRLIAILSAFERELKGIARRRFDGFTRECRRSARRVRGGMQSSIVCAMRL